VRGKRIDSIDELRGFAIVSMIIVNFLAHYPEAPLFLKHTRSTGFTFADLVAPLFMFILGIMYRKSFCKRIIEEGSLKTYFHFTKRYVILYILGVVGNLVIRKFVIFRWGVLQAIGLSGIIVLPLMKSSRLIRLTSAVILLFLYQFSLITEMRKDILAFAHGGPTAAISWSTIILFASIAGDMIDFKKIIDDVKKLFLFGIIFLSSGIILSNYIPVSKPQVNISYIILSVGLSALLLALFLLLNDLALIKIPTLGPMGRNPLLLYGFHYLLIAAGFFLIPVKSPVSIIFTGVLLICLLSYGFARYLEKSNFILHL